MKNLIHWIYAPFLVILVLSFSSFAKATTIKQKEFTDKNDPSKTQILILGSPHLSSVSNCLDKSSLEPLLKLLEQYDPDIVALEKVPAPILEDMERRGDFFNEIIMAFDRSRFEAGKEMQKKLGLSRTEAEKLSFKILNDKKEINDTLRIQLIGLLVAAYEFNSAVLHWSQISDRSKINNDLLPLTVVEKLEHSRAAPNEAYSIGVELAKRLKQRRVYDIDDHFDENILNQFAERLMAELKDNKEYKAAAEADFYNKSQKELEEACKSSVKMLELYKNLNTASYWEKDMAIQWDVWFRTKLPSRLDRADMPYGKCVI